MRRTHIYQQGYGSPEVDHTTPQVRKAEVSEDGLAVRLRITGLVEGHVHDLDITPVRSAAGENPLHVKAYYTLNEIPK